MFRYKSFMVVLTMFATTAQADDSMPELSIDELENLKVVHFVSMVSLKFTSTYSQANSPAFRDLFVDSADKQTDQFYKFHYSESYKDELNEGYWDYLGNLSSCSYVDGRIDGESCSITYERQNNKDDRNLYNTKLVLNYESEKKLVNSVACNHTYARLESGVTTSTSCIIDSLQYGEIEHLRETKDESTGVREISIWITHTISYKGKSFVYKYLSGSADYSLGVKSDVFLNGRDVTANKHIRELDRVEQMSAGFSAKNLWPKMLMQPYGF